MDRLLWDRETHPEDIYRVKGVLSIGGSDKKYMVQVRQGRGARCTRCVCLMTHLG